MSGNDRRRRPLYGPPSSRRSTVSTYAPLVLTLTLASAGLAAWIWSERRTSSSYPPTDDEELYRYDSDEAASAPPPYPPQSSGSRAAPQSDNFLNRATTAVRSASPGLYDSAGRLVAAGTGALAAGAAALGLSSASSNPSNTRPEVRRQRSAREDGFSDHERWSEEASRARPDKGKGKAANAKRTVAIVVSAEPREGLDESIIGQEHTSILSHLPTSFDPATTALFVLIYAPGVSEYDPRGNNTSDALGGSYSTLSLSGGSGAGARLLDALATQGAALTGDRTRILPFSTPTGYVHMLRHLAPQLVYVADTPALSGVDGENLKGLKGWVGQTIVVVGDDGAGGLVDTETEGEEDAGRQRRVGWWEGSEMVGLGKGVEIVDVERVGEDWRRRVEV
ncbi:hypothetical protein BDZ85DRAFT_322629 [Elsinoe ampelina]|uniref:Uncharacterized protein n=1 Tax=Elsinoe ampelina TaxID=302913 RepID=A0A6A6G0L8_9PEZI|nr:hypothetical protein BDZ85DRAFT_322629 [Elsinoe ampelina]